MKKCLIWPLLFIATFGKALAITTLSSTTTLSTKDIESISDKIWQNESGKSIPWLTYWNPGESFPSLGIGHFIWYTAQKREDFDESFPKRKYIPTADSDSSVLRRRYLQPDVFSDPDYEA